MLEDKLKGVGSDAEEDKPFRGWVRRCTLDKLKRVSSKAEDKLQRVSSNAEDKLSKPLGLI